MACKCLHIVNSYSVSEGSTMMTLEFVNPVGSVADKQRFCIKLCTSIPDTYASYTAQVLVGGTGVPLLDKYGESLTISEINKGIVYQGYYGATATPHIIVNAPKKIGCRCA